MNTKYFLRLKFNSLSIKNGETWKIPLAQNKLTIIIINKDHYF